MDAKPTRRAMWSRGDRGPGMWILALLAMTGALAQACSDNKGPAGPTFPAGQTGTSDGGIVVFIGINPNSVEPGRRAGVTVVVRTSPSIIGAASAGGRPIPGLHVQLSTTAGSLDAADGFTDADGKFVTFLFIPCGTTGSAAVTAFVEGVVSLPGTVTIGAATDNSPCPAVAPVVP